MPRARVVLVHGLRTSATMWRRQLVELARHDIEVVAVDLPGHGKHLGGPFTVEAAMDEIDRALNPDDPDRRGTAIRHVEPALAAAARRAEPRRLPRDRVRGEASGSRRRTRGRIVRHPAAWNRPHRVSAAGRAHRAAARQGPRHERCRRAPVPLAGCGRRRAVGRGRARRDGPRASSGRAVRPRSGARVDRHPRVARERAVRSFPHRGAPVAEGHPRRATRRHPRSDAPGQPHPPRPLHRGRAGRRAELDRRAAARRSARFGTSATRSWYRCLLACVWVPPRTIAGGAPLPRTAHPVPTQTKDEPRGKHQVADQAHPHQPQGRRSATRPSRASSRPSSALPARPSPPATRRRPPTPSASRRASSTRPCQKGVIHQNQAANRKSAIAKQVAAL